MLAGLQASMVRTQLAEHVALSRGCPECRAMLRVEDRRPRRLQTPFSTLEVEAPPQGLPVSRASRQAGRDLLPSLRPAARRQVHAHA
jgi:hypothetical protein